MQFPMVGSWVIQVMAVKPFTIHGDVYYEIQGVRVDDPEQPAFVLRLAEHATAGQPTVGQRLQVSFLMGQVTEVVVKSE